MDTSYTRLPAMSWELAGRIAAALQEDGTSEPLAGLHLNRRSRPTEKTHGVAKPSLCVIAQGCKEVYLGERSYRYDANRFLLVTVELPAVGRIVEASDDKPYLAIRVDLDPVMVGSVMVEAGQPTPRSQSDAKALVVSTLDADLLDAAIRLVKLIDVPEQARVLAPLVKREIIFRLLIGEQGGRLRHLPMLGSHSPSIAQAVERLQKDFDRPLSIDGLAKELGMSLSGFHYHFKAITDMSPLQFQKNLRLQQAKRLMLGDNLDAASAAYRVGYEDASHFNRDYKRFFGEPPMRDMERLRGASLAMNEAV